MSRRAIEQVSGKEAGDGVGCQLRPGWEGLSQCGAEQAKQRQYHRSLSVTSGPQMLVSRACATTPGESFLKTLNWTQIFSLFSRNESHSKNF